MNLPENKVEEILSQIYDTFNEKFNQFAKSKGYEKNEPQVLTLTSTEGWDKVNLGKYNSNPSVPPFSTR